MFRRTYVLLASALVLGTAAPPAVADPEPWLPLVRQAWVTTSVQTVKTATLVDVVFGEDNTGDKGLHEYLFGDKTGYTYDSRNPCVPLATRQTRSFSKAYRRPGTYKLIVRFTSVCDTPGVEKTVAGETTLIVQPGKNPGNGPLEPTAALGLVGVSARKATMEARVADEDGFISKLVYKWGDKSKDTVFTIPLSTCKDPRTTWPATKWDDVPEKVRKPSHQYAHPGTYTVTVVAYSTGCNGKDVQTAETQWRFTV